MIEIKDLNFSYGSKIVLKDLNINLKSGITGIVGPNAAGKSTLMKCIYGMNKYNGSIEIKGKDLAGMDRSEKNRILGYLPQEETYIPRLTVIETVLLGNMENLSYKLSKDEIDQAYRVLSYLDLEDLDDRYLIELSGGQRQMVYIAQTLIKNPEIILMDEPTNNLDIKRQIEFCKMLRTLNLEKDISIVVILHDLNMATKYCDNILVMNNRGNIYDYGDKNIITCDLMKDVYGVDVDIIEHKGDKIIVHV